MLPFFIGVMAAMVFSLGATSIIGPEALLRHAWVDIVFWTLIAAGAAVSAINIAWECLPCKVARWSRRSKLSERLCADKPCIH